MGDESCHDHALGAEYLIHRRDARSGEGRIALEIEESIDFRCQRLLADV